jgi:peptidoglycan/xylan/chitin deacetylase (PgdA/CDA1 family)
MYHEVADPSHIDELSSITQRNYIVTREQFAQHLSALAAVRASTISLGLLRAWQRGEATLPENPVVITFDDGYSGNARYALPMLAQHGFTATFFIVTNLIGTRHMMSWAELGELKRQAMDVESHSVSHPLLSTIDRSRTLSELADSKRVLEDGLSAAVSHFALPYGDINEFYDEAIRSAGYDSGCSSRIGLNDSRTTPFLLRRIAMTSGTTPEQLGRIATQDPALLRSMQRRADLKRTVSRLLGKNNYNRLVNLYYGVKTEPGQSAS